jgi:hypothetical protein
MQQLEIIISLAGTAIGFLVTTAAFIMKFFKSAKAKRIAEQTIKIGNAVLPFIKQAETYINYTGQEKKEFVMTKANQYAIEQGFRFNAGIVDARVEELVKLTKEVNRRDKDKQSQGLQGTVIIGAKE